MSTLVAVMLAATAVAGCSKGSSHPKLASVDLVIGADLELTGKQSGIGYVTEYGLQIALENLASGFTVNGQTFKIRLLKQDNESNPKRAGTIAEQMITSGHANALISGFSPEASAAVSQVAERHHIPLISLAAVSSLANPPSRHQYTFTLGPRATDVAARLAGQLRLRRFSSVGLMTTNDVYGADGLKAMRAALKASGLNPKAEVVVPAPQRPLYAVMYSPLWGELDNAARTLVKAHCDAIVVWGQSPTSASATTSLRAAGFHGQILFDSGAGNGPTLSLSNRPAIDGALMAHPGVFTSSSLAVTTPAGIARQHFYYHYIESTPMFSGFAPYAADAVNLIVMAAQHANDINPGPIRTALEDDLTMDGLEGTYTFSSSNHSGLRADSILVFQSDEGEWSRVG